MKRRYLALKVEGGQSFDKRDLLDTIWDMLLRLFGEFGASQTNLSLVREYGEADEVVVIRCSHKALDVVKASVAAVTCINGEHVIIHVVGVSGTLRGLQKKLAEQ